MSDVSKFFDASIRLTDVRDELVLLAQSFERVGNSDIAKELRWYARLIIDSKNQMTEAYHDEINRGYKAAQENTANIFQAVLAGIKMGEKND